MSLHPDGRRVVVRLLLSFDVDGVGNYTLAKTKSR
jgi:hypothetical protein